MFQLSNNRIWELFKIRLTMRHATFCHSIQNELYLDGIQVFKHIQVHFLCSQVNYLCKFVSMLNQCVILYPNIHFWEFERYVQLYSRQYQTSKESTILLSWGKMERLCVNWIDTGWLSSALWLKMHWGYSHNKHYVGPAIIHASISSYSHYIDVKGQEHCVCVSWGGGGVV